jgi:hypothetical protein
LFNGENTGKHLAVVYGINAPAKDGFTQTSVLSFVDGTGKNEIRLHSQQSSLKVASALIAEKEWDSFRNRWTASSDGRAFSSKDFGEYAITVWDSEGNVDRVIHREYKPHVRTEEQSTELLEIYKGFTRAFQIPNMKYELQPNWNPVQQLWARDDGTLWVLSSNGARELPDGVAGRFDVYDKKGRYLKQVTLKGQGDATKDGYFFVKDRLFVVTDFLSAMMALQGGGGQAADTDDDAEPMQVISYIVK